jgi:hypothetical protein
MSTKTKVETKTSSAKPYFVRTGFIVHKERQNSRGQTVSETYDGDDPDNNIVELTDEELPKYRHQLELPDELPPESLAQ